MYYNKQNYINRKIVGGSCMVPAELNEEFKKILEYGYVLGNENKTIKANEFIDELSERLRGMLEKNSDQ